MHRWPFSKSLPTESTFLLLHMVPFQLDCGIMMMKGHLKVLQKSAIPSRYGKMRTGHTFQRSNDPKHVSQFSFCYSEQEACVRLCTESVWSLQSISRELKVKESVKKHPNDTREQLMLTQEKYRLLDRTAGI